MTNRNIIGQFKKSTHDVTLKKDIIICFPYLVSAYEQNPNI